MLENLLIGLGTMVVCLAMQAILVGLIVQFFHRQQVSREKRISFARTLTNISLVMLVLVTGNFFQVGIWAILFVFLGEFNEISVAVYHSAVNFSTLGYGDIVMSTERRLLGPLQAINGVLMIGVSTAVVMAAFQLALVGSLNPSQKNNR